MKNNLIDAYVARVGQNLPQKERGDIEAEIRSLLEDALESRAAAEKREVDEEMIVAVLKEHGDPQTVAASYGEPRYLIGPRLFPTFIQVIKIVIALIASVGLVGLIVQLTGLTGQTAANFFEGAIEEFADFAQSVFSAVGSVVLVFAVLEWFVPGLGRKKAAWDPRSLKNQQPQDSIEPAGLVADIVFNVAVIVLFNFFSGWIGASYREGLGWVKPIQLLASAFFRYLPWLTAAWSAKIVVDIVLLVRRSWSSTMRWIFAAVEFFTIGILIAMLFGPSLIDVTVIHGALNLPFMEPGFDGGINFSMRIVLGIIIVASGWDAIKVLLPEFNNKRIALPTVK
jgi:hypothetical protein